MPFRRILFCVAVIFILGVVPARAGLLDSILPEEGPTIGFVPKTADNIGRQLDEQLMRILEPSEMTRDQVSIACTVPVWLDNLKRTSPLARQNWPATSRKGGTDLKNCARATRFS